MATTFVDLAANAIAPESMHSPADLEHTGIV
jgi:hypothetical protein